MFDRWLVMTDLDGTLLNHHSYDYAAAVPALKKLAALEMPVIFNSSKTFAELSAYSSQLEIPHPFIVENGSAIFIPQDYFPRASVGRYLPDAQPIDHYLVLERGQSMQQLDHFLDRVNPPAVNFCRIRVEQAMALTGLSRPQALLAQTRLFSVPLLFDDPQQESIFIQQAEQASLSCLKGGRFLHLLGRCNKGDSMSSLKHLYQSVERRSFGIIALGDGLNDLAMLQQADIAVVVNSPSSAALSDRLNGTQHEFISTRQQAPLGWAEGIETVLDQINFKRGNQHGR